MNEIAHSRRSWLRRLPWLGVALAWSLRDAPARAAPTDEAILQPVAPSPRAFMDRAFEMMRRAVAEGDQPYGAVVVHEARIVGLAPSAVVTRGDPTAHAEMEAIRDAARRLGRRDLAGCILYSSSRPCPMCEAAAHGAGIERMIHGAELTDAGAPRPGVR